ncbi:MAG: ribosome-associated translation inhibitor RaiA [bacterium]|nr:ribosome-associated translation inhibitor RaiA [bacterium]
MKINIKATNLDLTPAMIEYINEKIGSLDKFVQRHERNGTSVIAIVEIARTTKHHTKGPVYRAEVNLDATSKNIARAEHEDWDIRVAVTEVKDKLKNILSKQK